MTFIVKKKGLGFDKLDETVQYNIIAEKNYSSVSVPH